MKKISKILLATSVLAFALTSCGSEKDASGVKRSKSKDANYQGYQAEIDPATGKIYDFGGMEVTYYDWWTNPDAPAASKQQEDEMAFRAWLEKTYNFKCVKKDLAGWGQNPTEVANFCITGSDKYAVFTIDGRSALSGLKANLWADLSKCDNIDWTKKKWTQGVIDKLRNGDSFYTFNVGLPEPRTGVFFNKRILQENGIDPELPYDLQKEGKWTWEAFEDLCKKLTKDTNNDGITDQWAMASKNDLWAENILYSNGVKLISKENGKFVNNAGTDAAMEAWDFVRRTFTTYQRPQLEGESWDYYFAAFQNGEVAFCCEDQYNCQPNGKFNSMKDDYGFVCCPMGPKGFGHVTTIHGTNMVVLPSFYDLDTAKKIMKIIDFYTEEVPGYDDPEAWKEGYWVSFRDERAVNETLQYMLDYPYESIASYVPDLTSAEMAWNICGGADPLETYERFKDQWQALIDNVN